MLRRRSPTARAAYVRRAVVFSDHLVASRVSVERLKRRGGKRISLLLVLVRLASNAPLGDIDQMLDPEGKQPNAVAAGGDQPAIVIGDGDSIGTNR